MADDFRSIAPYEGQDFEDAISRLRQYPQLLNNFTDIISRHNRIVNKWKSFHAKSLLAHLLTQVHSYTDFQEYITCDLFLSMIESSSIDEFSFGGVENLCMPDDDQVPGGRPHIFISNHRDIVLDTALLDLALFRSDRQMCEMVIGDNLLVNQFATDMFKVNGAVTIRRSLSSASDLRNETLSVSRYLKYAIETKKKSIWIAQKSGRSKDGVDNTSAAILKMLYLAYREEGLSFQQFLEKASIVPVSISYQYDPCDVTKSQEEIRKLKAEGVYNVYTKKKYADVLDLIRHQHFGYHVLVTIVAVGDHPVRILDDVIIGHERAVVKRHKAAAGRQKLVIGVVHLQHQHGFGRALNGVRIGRKAGFRQCAGGQEQAQGQNRRCKSLHNISPSIEHYIILLTRSQLCCRIPAGKAQPRSPAFSR